MRNYSITKVFLFLSIITLGLASCKKDDKGPVQMKAKIGGTVWEAAEVGAVVLPGLITITGKSTTGENITIRIQAGEVGDYLLSPGGDHVAVYQQLEGAQGFATNAPNGIGFVRVTAIDLQNATISGTFEFNGERPVDGTLVEIREGEFTDVKFESEVVTTGPNTLSCKIDGQIFTPASVFAILAGGKIAISANSSDLNKTIGMTLLPNIAVGEHDLSFFGDYTAQYNINQAQFLGADSGKVKITKHDTANHILEGTFHYEASDFLGTVSASVTEGAFSVKY